MDVELEPEQPEPVVRAVEELLRGGDEGESDPWWQAGMNDALGNG